jgi:antitoxin MazE
MDKMSKIRDNSQITIPKNIMDKLDLKKGDTISIELRDDEIVLKPVVIINKSQAWFWSKKWQKEEREAEDDIKAGRIKSFGNTDDLMKDLKK